MKENRIKKNHAFKGNVLRVRNDIVSIPGNKRATREFIEHPGAVGVLPVVNRTHIVLIRQYRYPIQKVTWEIPAGKIDRGEKPLACIKRELAEETGLKARRFFPLVSFWPTAAFSTEILYLYLAWDLSPTTAQPDEDEFLEVQQVKTTDALMWIKQGKIKDSKTIIALLTWQQFYKNKLFT